jgi:hypothetical protein
MGTKWFIEGDIKGCFDNIDHNILMNILREDIQDNRFLRLIEELLKAGYCEQWTYHPTHSGTPQGGSVSPILANIYMDKLDEYVEKTLIPEHTRGKKRKPHTEYRRLNEEAWRCRKRGNLERAETLRKQKQKLPSVDPYDQDYRRLRYIRYADDFLLGLTGTKAEAEEIKERLATFLKMKLNLTMAPEKTLVTHATQGRARFLGYEIGMMESQTKQTKKRRIVNGKVGLYIPKDVTHKKCAQYTKEGKAVHRPELLHYSEYDTITRYQWEYRGLVEYYAMAQNIHTLSKLHWTMETSLLKTLANKNRTTVRKTQLRLKAKQQTPHGPRACLKLIVPREKKKPLTAVFGGISLRRRMNTAIKDQVITPYVHIRSGVVERLVRDT